MYIRLEDLDNFAKKCYFFDGVFNSIPFALLLNAPPIGRYSGKRAQGK